MFEGFTDRARRIIQLAQEEARTHGHGYLYGEHILLGIVSDEDGLAMKVLEKLNISPHAVRTHIEETITPQKPTQHKNIMFSQQAKNVLEISLREALTLGHNYLGSEHILVGLVRQGEGIAAHTLVTLGADQGSLIPRIRNDSQNLYNSRRSADPVGLLREVQQETHLLQAKIQEMESSIFT